MQIRHATDAATWDTFLASQQFRPFLQSWTMGEVYRAIGQPPIRLQTEDNNAITGLCFGHIVRARRGTHLAIPYGPIVSDDAAIAPLIEELKNAAKEQGCSFIRLSPFWTANTSNTLQSLGAVSSPLHMLAEHLWYLPLQQTDPWSPSPLSQQGGQRVGGAVGEGPGERAVSGSQPRSEDELFKNFRSTTRNLIRRAQKEGVTIHRSDDPGNDLRHFITLHDETRKRHGFTPYTNAFFREQLLQFHARGEATLYMARYQDMIIASSIHMHVAGETSYHHGASTHAYAKIPASYLLQWTAIQDALKRGDRVYNFWGIAPVTQSENPESRIPKSHPFAGVTLFKMGFGGNLLPLTHCVDIPLSSSYYLTRGFEFVRKWKRGF